MSQLPNLIRTRFAPSPTGELHVGGARTALFNYLLAKQRFGKFVLRIEDTDLKRNQEEFVKKQYNDLCWLGLKPDESIFQKGEYGPYRQSQRIEIYHQYINKLLWEKKAYYCFCSLNELVQEKEEYIQKNHRGNYQYSRKCLKLKKNEIENNLKQKKDYVIRCKVNQDYTYELNDLARGKVIFQGRDIEDFVLCRSNGIPLLNLAVVIDDYLMKITHILRGEEHLSNTAKQLVLYEALNWQLPYFAHLSIILNKERKKLSKRDQETNQFQLISQLRELGYLPTAITNYLLLLGWHPGTTQEVFSLSEAIQAFNLKGLHTSGAIYNLEKLNWYNNYYIQKLTNADFTIYAYQFLINHYNIQEKNKEKIGEIASLFRPQLNYFHELIDLTNYFFSQPKKTNITLEQKKTLENVKEIFVQRKNWDKEEINDILKKSSENSNLPKKDFYLLIREVLTGKEKGPELLSIIYLLGKEVVVKRLFWQ